MPQNATRAGSPRARWPWKARQRRRLTGPSAAGNVLPTPGCNRNTTAARGRRIPIKNLLLVNETTSKVVYLGPTIAGRTHDKKAADEAKIAYPTNATLDQDTGFQGYEPEGVLTQQPKKSPKARS